jgi:hypothetical protein
MIHDIKICKKVCDRDKECDHVGSNCTTNCCYECRRLKLGGSLLCSNSPIWSMDKQRNKYFKFMMAYKNENR